jgi:hypothetical protein
MPYDLLGLQIIKQKNTNGIIPTSCSWDFLR